MIIGVDFDNTLISYDAVFSALASEQAFINPDAAANKKSVRDQVRQLPDGELKWQKLQSLAYGARILEAKMIDGVAGFFSLCKQQHVPVYIISHRTETSPFGAPGESLREAARTWMSRNGVFDERGFGLSPEQVYFGSTRLEKIGQIVRVGCSHFIDDLEEVFQEKTFPAGVNKLLYSPDEDAVAHDLIDLPRVMRFQNWQQIGEYIFGHC